MKIKIFLTVLTAFVILSCEPSNSGQEKEVGQKQENRAKNGAEIDQASLHLVDEMEQAMGTKKAYDAIETVQWNFFGARMWWWNKWNGDVRVEHLKDDLTIVMNINTKVGRVVENGKEITDPDALKEWLDKGFSWWINDSYWLVMPFKLRDPGVHLQYLGIGATTDSLQAEKMRMTFDQVGLTPNNAYDLYFDPQSHMLVQWDFFKNASDSISGFQMPWKGYNTYSEVLFSGDRGERKMPSIATDKEWSDGTFSDPNKKAKVY